MKRGFYLSTCDTCRRILSAIDLPGDFPLQDIKKEPVSAEQLEVLARLAGSYEALFNKRARLYKEQQLKEKNLQEEDYRQLLLTHYTFLKRPVFVFDEVVFVGNAGKTVEELKAFLKTRA